MSPTIKKIHRLFNFSRISKSKKTLCVVAVLFPFFVFVFLNFLFPLPRWKLERDYSQVFFSPLGAVYRVTLSPSGVYRLKVNFDQTSKEVLDLLITTEDKYFYRHLGVNPVSVIKALMANIQRGKIVSGASTITMQVAKLIDRKPRNMKNKIIETFRALQLEWSYSKKEILEFYLSSIPLGGNLEGLGAGSYFYFGKHPSELSLAEAASLCAIPNSPEAYRLDRFPEANKKRKNAILRKALKNGFHSSFISNAFAYEYKKKRLLNPSNEMHLVERLKDRTFFELTLTLNTAIQQTVKGIVDTHVSFLEKQKIHNLAVIVAENSTKHVLAYLGNRTYSPAVPGGMINCAYIQRSFGSAFKPFIYAQGIEKGIITPKRVVYDIPRDYDNYAPVNFSKTYFGAITATEALNESYNIPAVYLEYQLKDERQSLKTLLKETLLYNRGFSPSHLLLDRAWITIALGTFPITLEELTELYMIFSSRGRYAKLKFTREEETSSREVLSKEACYIISEMLGKNLRTDLPSSWEFTPSRGRVAFKTGTSFGLKDAVTVAYNPTYTVAVWLGNASGEYSPALIGRKQAAPIAIEIMNYLLKHNDTWFDQPQGVKTREVSPLSGLPKNKHTVHPIEDLFIPGVSENRKCPIEQILTLTRDERYRLCPSCQHLYRGKVKKKLMRIWDLEYAWFLRTRHRDHDEIPPMYPGCPDRSLYGKPKIIYPREGGYYQRVSNTPLEFQKIPLKCYASPDVKKIFWYCDNELIAEGEPDEIYFYQAKTGVSTIAVVDDQGRSEAVEIRIH